MRQVLVAAMVLSTAGALPAQSACKLEGVWQLVSGSEDGKPYPAGSRKPRSLPRVISRFVSSTGRPKDLKTIADSLAAYRSSGSGGGTYTLQGMTYTETLEYFSDPSYVGKSLAFTCRQKAIASSRPGPSRSTGRQEGPRRELEEVWRRVE